MIIFDLDDTLIDTSGSVTPFKMRECLKRLIEGGLCIDDFEKAHAHLLALNLKCTKSKEAIERFAASRGFKGTQIQNAIDELISPLPSDFFIPTTPFAKEILHHYSSLCPIALVTGGHPPFQWEKLKRAGIDTSLFSKIAIPEDSIKKPCYQEIVREFSVSPRDVWVCGDRIAMDLAPAFELGFHTIHMRWGRGARGSTEKWVDGAIANLSELKRIIQ